jgi:hypothetical protein
VQPFVETISNDGNVLFFCKTKDDTANLYQYLVHTFSDRKKSIDVNHASLTIEHRTALMSRWKNDDIKVLVCTKVLANVSDMFFCCEFVVVIGCVVVRECTKAMCEWLVILAFPTICVSTCRRYQFFSP